jgi:sporulation-control protein spo0M
MKKVNLSLNKLSFYPREEIICDIQLNFKKETKVKSIELLLIGQYRAWTEDSEGGTVSTTNQFMELKEIVWSPAGEEWERIPGNSRFVSKFIVPDEIVPSFPPEEFTKKNYHGLVEYFIKLSVRKPRGLNKNKRISINLRSTTFRSVSNEFWKEGQISPKPSKPSLYVQLENAQFKPGEAVRGHFMVDNQQAQSNIRKIDVMLRNQVTSKVKHSRARNESIFIDGIEVIDYINAKISFEFFLPPNAFPTITGGIVHVRWDIQVKVDIKRARDVVLTLPILVGSVNSIFETARYMTTPISDVNFCPYCGIKVETGSSSCPVCGNKLE